MAITIYYDGECPICARFSRMVRLERQGPAELVDLRTATQAREELAGQGFDVDAGMVVDLDGKRLGGADAVNALALLSSRSDLFNRLSRALLSSPPLASVIYPLLRMGRWLLLLLKGRSLIGGEASGSARQTIFATCFALFSIFHFCNYATEYGRFPPGPDMLAILGAAVLVLFRPQSSRALFLLMAVSLVSAWVQAPAQSNHTITRNFLLLGYVLSFAVAMIRNRDFREIFGNFAIAGGSVLVVMYFYGIFHKINADFLDPVTSCATTLWAAMPWPLASAQGPLVDYSTIYGTFVVEGLIALALLVRPWRHYGIAAGIAFHLLLAMSSYSLYIAFTTLSIAMHSLFLSEEASRNILASKPMAALRARMRDPVYLTGAIVLLLIVGLMAFGGAYGTASMLAMPLVLPFCWIILRHGHAGSAPGGTRPTAAIICAVVAAGFFLNNAMPYFGLKTAQSVNMFANLRLEGGVSNHLVFSGPHRPFDYLEKVAVLEDGGGDPELQGYVGRGFGIVYYDVLAFLADNPDRRLSFTLDGRTYRDVSAADLRADIEATLHASVVRKWFHFQPVQLGTPERCSI